MTATVHRSSPRRISSDVADPDLLRGLHPLAAHVDVAAEDGLGRGTASLEETRRPEPLVDANPVHLAGLRRRAGSPAVRQVLLRELAGEARGAARGSRSSSGARNSFSSRRASVRRRPSARLPVGGEADEVAAAVARVAAALDEALLLELVEQADELAPVVAERVGDRALRLARALVEREQDGVVVRGRGPSARTPPSRCSLAAKPSRLSRNAVDATSSSG